jgi:hypothetical protein
MRTPLKVTLFSPSGDHLRYNKWRYHRKYLTSPPVVSSRGEEKRKKEEDERETEQGSPPPLCAVRDDAHSRRLSSESRGEQLASRREFPGSCAARTSARAFRSLSLSLFLFTRRPVGFSFREQKRGPCGSPPGRPSVSVRVLRERTSGERHSLARSLAREREARRSSVLASGPSRFSKTAKVSE